MPRSIRFTGLPLVLLVAAISIFAEDTQPLLKYADELLSEVHRSVDGPEKAFEFRMDFGQPTEIEYRFHQKQSMNNSFSSGAMESESVAVLVLKSEGDRTARVIIRDQELSMTINGEEEEPSSISRKAPTVVVPGLNENGRFTSPSGGTDPMIRMLFPLPEEPLGPGGSFQSPIELPFNAMGSLLWARGDSTIRFTGYVNLRGHLGARLDVTTKVQDLEIPDEIDGNYSFEVAALGTYYFDLESRTFESGAMAIRMKMNVQVPATSMPQFTDDDSPEDLEMSMDLDGLIRYSRALDWTGTAEP